MRQDHHAFALILTAAPRLFIIKYSLFCSLICTILFIYLFKKKRRKKRFRLREKLDSLMIQSLGCYSYWESKRFFILPNRDIYHLAYSIFILT